MNTRATSSLKTSLEEQCFHALRELPDAEGMSEAERALYERIAEIEDPLQWQEQEGDVETAVALWQSLSKETSLSIQVAAINAALRSLKAVAAAPPDGYI